MPRFRGQGTFVARRQMEHAQAAVLAAAARDAEPSKPVSRRAVPSPEDLRGIPATAKGVSGTIRGTAPHLIEFA